LSNDDFVAYVPSGGIHRLENNSLRVREVKWIPVPHLYDTFVRQRDSMNLPFTLPDDDGTLLEKLAAVCAATLRDIVSERHL